MPARRSPPFGRRRSSASSCRPSTSAPTSRSWSSGSRELLAGCDWEVVFVDDNSPDGTAAVARRSARPTSRVRCMRRIGRRGLAGACLEGMLASQARYVAVMDADLQHDERLLVAMLDRLRAASRDLVVASRYLCGGSAAGSRSSAPAPAAGQHAGARPPRHRSHRSDERPFHDPARRLRTAGAGDFLARLQDSARHSGDGPAACASSSCRRTFHERRHGESKLDSKVALDFAALW